MIIDTHTHHSHRTCAIINAPISDFEPSDGFYYSVGIHPWDIHKTDCEKALKSITELTTLNTHIVAIGECGLDPFSTAPDDEQLTVFEKHIALSEQLEKPLIIHCVKRYNEILQLHRCHKPQQPWILHGFRSNANVLRPLLAQSGIYFSIGEKFNEEAVKLIPSERLLIETDESLLSIEEIASRIATARGETTQELLNSIAQNNRNLFLTRG
jgi:TatD DNase family protein